MAKKILLIALGSTARADCISEAIVKSPQKPELYSYLVSRNPSVMKKSKEVKFGKLEDFASIKDFAKKIKPDFAVISPDYALAIGVADALAEGNVPSFGPKKALAKLESSKSFTRNLMQKYGIEGNPEFRIFSGMDGVRDCLLDFKQFVIKPDGLTGGKGVKVFGEHLKGIDDSLDYCKEIIASGSNVIIEEKMEGEEFSLQCISDGKTVVPMPAVQDHKRAFENDTGMNTGGMGSYGCSNHLLPFLKKKDVDDAVEITKKVADALHKETYGYFKGIMYGGFMRTKDGVKLIEYNARFGDPEVMNVLPIMKTDFIEVCEAVVNGTLASLKIEFENKATVCKYAVPEGYPVSPKNGAIIDISALQGSKARVYLGAVEQIEGNNPFRLKMGTSRAIACVGIADSLEEAEKISEEAIMKINGPVFHRRDIGTKELVQKRVAHVNELLRKK